MDLGGLQLRLDSSSDFSTGSGRRICPGQMLRKDEGKKDASGTDVIIDEHVIGSACVPLSLSGKSRRRRGGWWDGIRVRPPEPQWFLYRSTAPHQPTATIERYSGWSDMSRRRTQSDSAR